MLFLGPSAHRVFGSVLVRFFSTSPVLTPVEVTALLRESEFTSSRPMGPVKSYDLNTLRSNNPIEDSHSEGVVNLGGSRRPQVMFGMFDGHGGAACGQVVARRLLDYVAASLLTPDDLKLHLEALRNRDTSHSHHDLVQYVNRSFELVEDLRDLYKKSYLEHISSLDVRCRDDPEAYNAVPVPERLVQAFAALDNDLSNEAISSASDPASSELKMKTLAVAMSGSVAAVAHIEGADLHVASTGDCNVVLGTLSENDTWYVDLNCKKRFYCYYKKSLLSIQGLPRS